jgi:broad specificity phosphatase PhoE
MSFATDTSELLTTRQAAELVGRSLDSVKRALNFGTLNGRREDGFWRIRPEDVLAWDARACRQPSRTSKRAYDRAAEVLGEYGSVTPDELAQLLMIHAGNARKHLAILGNQRRAHRHDDGEWFPGPSCRKEATS